MRITQLAVVAVVVAAIPPEASAQFRDPQPIAYGDWVSGRLESGDLFAVYQFEGTAGDGIAIHVRLVGGAADVVCFALLSSQFNVCGGDFFFDARYHFEGPERLPATGVYTILVHSDLARGPDMDFWISLHRIAPPLPELVRPLGFQQETYGRIDVGEIAFSSFNYDPTPGDSVRIGLAAFSSGSHTLCFELRDAEHALLAPGRVCGTEIGHSYEGETALTRRGTYTIRAYEPRFFWDSFFRVSLQCTGACRELPPED